MKIEKIIKAKMEVETYNYEDVTVYFEDDGFKERILENIKKIAPVLALEGEGMFFVFDMNRLYKITSTDEIFDILEKRNEYGHSDYTIREIENIQLFLEEEHGSDNFIGDFVKAFEDDPNTTVGSLLKDVLEYKRAVLNEDSEILMLSK